MLFKFSCSTKYYGVAASDQAFAVEISSIQLVLTFFVFIPLGSSEPLGLKPANAMVDVGWPASSGGIWGR